MRRYWGPEVIHMYRWIDAWIIHSPNVIYHCPETYKFPRVPQAGGWCRGWSRIVEGWGDFLKSKYKVFKVSKFQTFKSSISCFLVGIDPLPKSFKILLYGYPDLFGHRLFHFSKCSISEISRSPKSDISPKWFGYFLVLVEVSWRLQSWTSLVLGLMVTSGRSEKHENDGLSSFAKWHRQVLSPKSSKIIMRSFWVMKIAPQTPQTPNPDFSRFFLPELRYFP